MDFFEAQDRSLARSKWLMFYFFSAVVLIIAAVYFAVTAGVFFYHYKVGAQNSPACFSAVRIMWTALGVLPLVCLGSLWRITQLRRSGGSGVALSLGGRRIPANTGRPEERQLRNVVEEMAIASGLPVPQVYVLDRESGVNAFAAGFGFDDAVIGVTRGALEQFDREELQGVVAHEFSHILNGDMRLNTMLCGWVYGIVMLTILGRGFWQLIKGDDSGDGGGRVRWGRSRGGGGGGSGNSKGGGALILAIILVAVLITIIGFIGEFFARLIQAAVSRQREYLADASAVQFTRNPEGIGNALRRIGGIPRYSILRNPNASEFAHSFFAHSLRSEVSFLATHPPLGRRISRVLKDWKGDYLKPRLQPEPKHAKAPRQKPRTGFGGALGPVSGRGTGFQQMLTAGLFMRCLGQLRVRGQEFVHEVKERLDAEWLGVMDDPEKCPALFLALIYQLEEAGVSPLTADLLGHFPGYLEWVDTFVAKLSGLGRGERLIMTELIAARLSDALIEPERDKYIACVEALVQADEKVTSFELACLQMVRRQLLKDSAFAPVRQDASQVIQAACVLTTRLVAETALKGADAASILQTVSRQAPYFMNQLEPVDDVDHVQIAEAFGILARTPFGIRKQFLEVCERIVAADQQATMEEVELLRAIAIGIGVPAAPIFPEEEA